MKFKTVEDEIRPILQDDMMARYDDMYLYYLYVKSKIAGTLSKAYMQEVFAYKRFRIEYGIASYDTVSRCRRKIQAKDKTMRPTEAFVKARKKAEIEYMEYAKRKA